MTTITTTTTVATNQNVKPSSSWCCTRPNVKPSSEEKKVVTATGIPANQNIKQAASPQKVVGSDVNQTSSTQKVQVQKVQDKGKDPLPLSASQDVKKVHSVSNQVDKVTAMPKKNSFDQKKDCASPTIKAMQQLIQSYDRSNTNVGSSKEIQTNDRNSPVTPGSEKKTKSKSPTKADSKTNSPGEITKQSSNVIKLVNLGPNHNDSDSQPQQGNFKNTKEKIETLSHNKNVNKLSSFGQHEFSYDEALDSIEQKKIRSANDKNEMNISTGPFCPLPTNSSPAKKSHEKKEPEVLNLSYLKFRIRLISRKKTHLKKDIL